MDKCLVCKKAADNILGHIECLMVIKAFETMEEQRLVDKVASE